MAEFSEIKEAYPTLVATEEYKRFTCPKCGAVNGTNVYLDGEAQVVICGDCWAKSNIEEVV